MQFDVTYSCDKQNKLKDCDGNPTHTLLIYGLYHGRIVAHENDATSYPFICPEGHSKEDCEHFFPINMLCAMPSIQMDGECLIFPYSANALCSTSVRVDCDDGTWKGMYDCDAVPLMEKYFPPVKISFRRFAYPNMCKMVRFLIE